MRSSPLTLRVGFLRKSAAATLLFTFLLPLYVSAQTPVSDPPPDSSVTESPSTQSEPDSVTEDGVSIGTPTPSSLLSGSGPDSVELLRKTIDPKFYSEPDSVTGSLVYKYPLTLPPGRNGMQPDLSLVYSSQPHSNTNILGYGWDLSIPYIERVNKTGTDSLYTATNFYSSLDGELLPVAASSTDYGARVDTGTFNRYTFASSTWTMLDKQGRTYYFGTSTDGRQDNPSDSTKVFRWMLQKVVDANGNYITYYYAKDKGEIYPQKILYTGSNSDLGIFEVDLARENRSDVATSSAADFAVVSSQRIKDISVKVNGTLTREYALSYTTGVNGARSLISGVIESGVDLSGASTTLPATAFQYQPSTKGWAQTDSIHPPIGLTSSTYVADLNGDGLADLLTSSTVTGGAATNTAYINTTTGWTASSTWTPPIHFWVDDVEQGVRLVDVNGDQRTDIVQSISGTVNTYLNNGSGWTASSTWNSPVFLTNGSGQDQGVRFVDINGDGLMDIVKAFPSAHAVYLNTGSGWTASSTWSVPLDFVGSSGEDQYVRLEDVNGDGLVDILQGYFRSGDVKDVYLNTGSGWTLDPQWVLPEYFSKDPYTDYGTRLADLNGDGLMDVIHYHNNAGDTTSDAYINNGHGWTEDPEWVAPTSFATGGVPDEAVFADMNGDGMLDLWHLPATNGSVYINNSRRTDLLTAVNFPEGGRATFIYKAAQEYLNGQQTQSPHLPFAVNTLYESGLYDGIGTTASTTYSYWNGEYYFNNSLDRKFAGFGLITKTDGAGNVTKSYFHQGNASASTTGEYLDTPAKVRQMYRNEMYDNAGNLYAKSIFQWDQADLGADRAFVKLIRQTDFTYDGHSSHKEKAVTYAYDDTYGNPTVKNMWGQVSGSDDGSFTDSGSDLVIATTTYATSTVGYLPALPSTVSVANQSGTKIKESRYYYDGQSLNNSTIGNLTKEESWITGSTYASSTKAYNAYGLVTSVTDPRGYTTSFTYDAPTLYAATSTNPLGQSQAYVYDYSSGKVATSTDLNGAKFATVYDGLGRIRAVLVPNVATSSALVTASDYLYTDTAFPSIRQRNYLSATSSADAYTYLDGLGRVRQQRSESEQNGDYATRDFAYDSRGMLQKESLPYFSNGTATTSATTNVHLYTTYTYDPLLRQLVATSPVGTTVHAYNDWVASTTDANGHHKDFTYDAYGRLARVTEYLATSTQDTQYTYDGDGNLTKITDALGNIRNFTYDGMDRLLSDEDIHAVTDTTFGSSTYAYDLSGNRSSFTDPVGHTTNYMYDGLNRILTEDYTGAAGTEKTYTYDACSFGVGRLCSVGTQSATTTYTYDSRGRTLTEANKLDGVTYTHTYTYDLANNVLTVTYPDSAVVRYTYNDAGLLEGVTEQENGTSTVSTIVSNLDYAPHGVPSYQSNGNGTETFNTYDQNSAYRLIERKTIGPGGGVSLLMSASSEQELALDSFDEAAPAAVAEPVEIAIPDLATPTSKTFYTGMAGGERTYKTRIAAEAYHRSNDSSTAGSADIAIGTDASSLFTFTQQGDEITASLADGKAEHAEPVTTSSLALYSEALGDDTAIEVTKGDGYVEKKVRLDRIPNGTGDYRVTFKLSFTGTTTPDALVDGVALSSVGSATSTQGARLLHNDRTVGYIWPTFVEDATATYPGHRIPIAVNYELQGNDIYLTKVIPQGYLHDATYPVRADFILSAFAAAGDGTVETQPYPAAWATQHADTTGRNASYSDSTMYVRSGAFDSSNGYLGISRIFVPFNTSSLPDNAVISSSTLHLYATGKWNDFNDAFSYVTVYQGTPNSPSALIDSDINDCGIETNPTKGSSDVTVSGVATSTYVNFPLNSTGKGWISTTGYTTLCLREGHDSANDAATNNSGTWKFEGITFATSEASGTSTDPYLEIEYTLPDTAPGTPSALRAEGATNPVNVTTGTPRIDAQFNDADPGDTMSAYDVQVSTNAGVWTSPVWDSGKVATSSATVAGTQSQAIPFGGTPLASDATTYYWRIKFWDAADQASGWSDPGSFTMADDNTVLQDFLYDYDPVGNITQVIDNASTTLPRRDLYSYDSLDRLTHASLDLWIDGSNPNWFNAAWPYRIRITSNHTQVSSTTDSLYLNLATLPSHFHSNVRSDGCDIRMTTSDQHTEVPVDLVSYDAATDSGELHFRATGLATTTDTSWYVYYGYTGASCPASNASNGAQQVWNGSPATWHLKENSGSRSDSSANSNTLSSINSVGTTTGALGTAANFVTASSQYLSITNGAQTGLALTSGTFTIEGWVKFSTLPSLGADAVTLLNKMTSGPGGYRLIVGKTGFNQNKLAFYYWDNSGNDTIQYSSSAIVSSGEVGTWMHLAIVVDPSTHSVKMYKNGQAVSVSSQSTGASAVGSNSEKISMGAVNTDATPAWFMQGGFDEFRIATSSFSSGRVLTDYNNMASSTFWSTDAYEVLGTTTWNGKASTTIAYDGLGNITSKSDVGTYLYAGTGYANSHAVTQIATSTGTSTFTYDANGNLLTGGGLTNTWNYLNQLTQTSMNGRATTTMTYDYLGNRVSYATASTTTYYPSKDYTVVGTTTLKNIYVNGTLAASVLNNGTSTVYWEYQDYLGGTNLTVNSNADAVERILYEPFGAIESDSTSGSFSQSRKYIGQYYDGSTGLNYLNARYYNGSTGNFLSEDPSHLAVGDPNKLKQITGQDQQSYLADPQTLNSYSYARDNPITKSDPSGNCPLCALGLIGGGIGIAGTYAGDVLQNRADGITGLSAYAPRSTPAQYGVNAAAGAFGAVFITENVLITGGIAALGSVGYDVAGGNNPNLVNAGLSSGITLASGGLLRGTVGQSLLETAIQNGSKISSPVLSQGLRYATVRETLNTASNVLSQNAFRTQQTNSSQNSTFSSILNQISRTLSNIKAIISK